MELICDKRETKVLAHAKDLSAVKAEFLTVGDFILGIRRGETFIPLVIVERKTWSDLAASVKDGRIKNIEKLRKFREETGARIAYLLEGTPPRNPAALVDGIPLKNLRAHLDHLLFRDGIIELHSLSAADSLRRLLEFLSNLKKYGEERAAASDPDSEKDGVAAAKVRRALTDEEVHDKIWATFDGISLSSAPAFRAIGVKKMLAGQVSASELAEVRVGAKKFGEKRAAAIISSLSKETCLEKVLCALPGISSKRARLIIDCLAEGTEPLPIQTLFTNWGVIGERVRCKVGEKCARVVATFLVNE